MIYFVLLQSVRFVIQLGHSFVCPKDSLINLLTYAEHLFTYSPPSASFFRVHEPAEERREVQEREEEEEAVARGHERLRKRLCNLLLSNGLMEYIVRVCGAQTR